MKLFLISKPEHAQVVMRTLTHLGHEVSCLGPAPTEVPPSCDALICRIESCSHLGSELAYRVKREGKIPVIFESSVSRIVAAVKATLPKGVPEAGEEPEPEEASPPKGARSKMEKPAIRAWAKWVEQVVAEGGFYLNAVYLMNRSHPHSTLKLYESMGLMVVKASRMWTTLAQGNAATQSTLASGVTVALRNPELERVVLRRTSRVRGRVQTTHIHIIVPQGRTLTDAQTKLILDFVEKGENLAGTPGEANASVGPVPTNRASDHRVQAQPLPDHQEPEPPSEEASLAEPAPEPIPVKTPEQVPQATPKVPVAVPVPTLGEQDMPEAVLEAFRVLHKALTSLGDARSLRFRNLTLLREHTHLAGPSGVVCSAAVGSYTTRDITEVTCPACQATPFYQIAQFALANLTVG